MRTDWLARALAACALLVICAIAGFFYLFAHRDPVVSLGNGYRYFGAEDGMTVLDRGSMSDAQRQRVMDKWNESLRKNIYYDIDDLGAPRVGPNVDSYRVFPKMITGHVSSFPGKPKHSDPHSEKKTKPGYFIIDTRINKIYRGLSKQKWRVQLRKYGLNQEPQLLKTSK